MVYNMASSPSIPHIQHAYYERKRTLIVLQRSPHILTKVNYPPLDFGSFVNKPTMCVALTNCGALIKHYLNFKAIYALGHHQPLIGFSEMRGRTEAKRALSKLEKGYFVCYAGLSKQGLVNNPGVQHF